MNKLKRWFKDNRLITTLFIALAIAAIYLLMVVTNDIFNHVDKQRCLNKSFEQLKEDVSCDKYWRDE